MLGVVNVGAGVIGLECVQEFRSHRLGLDLVGRKLLSDEYFST